MTKRTTFAAAAALWICAAAVWAAPPGLPARLAYQGRLLAAGGAPRTGPVDLRVRVWDAPAGGALVYAQPFANVPLGAGGVFAVTLGPTGAATDPIATPLTTSLADALGAEVGAGGTARFLEVTVGAEPPLGRTQVLTAAYALEAARATRAESAATAGIAAQALDATSAGGVPSSIVEELLEHVSADGGEPPNHDPREGLADLDGDGIANFVDADNDGDGLDDEVELAGGSDMSLVTPRIFGLTPGTAFAGGTGPVVIDGSGFLPGATVQFGAEAPVPSSASPTQLRVSVGPQPAGTVDVTVTLPNGESTTLADDFTFTNGAIPHTISFSAHRASLDVLDGAFDLALGGAQEQGSGSSFGYEFPLSSNGRIALAWDGTATLTGVRCRSTAANACAFELLRDADGDRDLADEQAGAVPIETFTSGLVTPDLSAAELDYDAAGRAVVAYVRRIAPAAARIARDLDGDGDFDGAGEKVSVDASIGGNGIVAGELALDPAGRVAFAYYNANAGGMRVAWDRNGDHDFADTVAGTPELVTVATGPPACAGAAFDGGGRLTLVVGVTSGTPGVRLLRDLDGDGDFDGAGEDAPLAGASGASCDVAGLAGGPLAVTVDDSVYIDGNGDDDFDDAGETTDLGIGFPSATRIVLNGAGFAAYVSGSFLQRLYWLPVP